MPYNRHQSLLTKIISLCLANKNVLVPFML